MRTISRLHYITTSAALTEQACMGGVDWIQLRLKNTTYDEYKKTALAVQAVCKQFGATLIINDSIKLALEIGADGVHVGKEDPLPQADIDRMLDRGGVIGCTCNTIADFMHLDGKPVSYIGLGPFRFTNTKINLSPILGLEGYTKLFAALKARGMNTPPVIGIGGIEADDVVQLLETGLHGVAVSGAISNADSVTLAARVFTDLTNRK